MSFLSSVQPQQMDSHYYVGAHSETWGGVPRPMDHIMHKSMQFVNVVNFKEPRYHKNQTEEHYTPSKTTVSEAGVNKMYYRLQD